MPHRTIDRSAPEWRDDWIAPCWKIHTQAAWALPSTSEPLGLAFPEAFDLLACDRELIVAENLKTECLRQPRIVLFNPAFHLGRPCQLDQLIEGTGGARVQQADHFHHGFRTRKIASSIFINFP
jgi:hypothetical protein